MNEIKDYFEPIANDLIKAKYKEGTYGFEIANRKIKNLDNSWQLALIGLPESRNAYNGSFECGNDLIRRKLYELSSISKAKLIDLGNLKLGKQVKDTYASVNHITQELLNKGLIPVYFGGSQDLTVPIVNAINDLQSETELCIIDSKIDSLDEEYHSNSYLNKIKAETAQKVLISILGYQSYFVTNKEIEVGTANSWNLFRLGVIRNNFSQIEPILRDSCIVSFDLSCVRQSESPAGSFSSPNGFYAEESCQLANLAGLSDKLKVFSLFEYQSCKDINLQSAHLSAQILWHFFYGFSQRKNDYPTGKLESYKKIYVKLEKLDSDLVFYENVDNKRFWVEIPIHNSKVKVISCSENDYKKACNNEIPDRIWQNISRYMK